MDGMKKPFEPHILGIVHLAMGREGFAQVVAIQWKNDGKWFAYCGKCNHGRPWQDVIQTATQGSELDGSQAILYFPKLDKDTYGGNWESDGFAAKYASDIDERLLRSWGKALVKWRWLAERGNGSRNVSRVYGVGKAHRM